MIEELEPGHRLNDLDHHNGLIQAVNALLRDGGRQGKAAWAVFQLTEDVKYPDAEDVTFPAGWSKVPDVPYAENCNRIFLNHYDNDHEEHAASPVTDHDIVYFPTVSTWEEGADALYGDGDRVFAFYNEQSNRWEAVHTVATPTLLYLFEITSAGTYDSVTTKEWYYGGKSVLFDTDTDLYTVQSGEDATTLWYPTAIREDLTDDAPSDKAVNTQVNFYVGQRVWVAYRASRYEIVSDARDEMRFELKDNLEPDDASATAYPRWWTGAAWVTDTTIEIEVYDPSKGSDSGPTYYGRGRQLMGSLDGSIGKVKYEPDSGRWVIQELTPHTLKIKGLLVTALETTDATHNIDNVVVMQPTGSVVCPDQLTVGGGNYVGATDATYITCYNSSWFAMEGDDNNIAVADWNATDEKWYFTQVECPA